MSSAGSVTAWIDALRTGDDAAAQELWERYYEKLVRLARQKLTGARRRAADEEDAALSAFDSFCQGVQQGRFPQLRDRDNLWPLLIVITERKAFDLIQHEKRQKRGGGAVAGESALINPADSSASQAGLDQVPAYGPTPGAKDRTVPVGVSALPALDCRDRLASGKEQTEGSAEITRGIGTCRSLAERQPLAGLRGNALAHLPEAERKEWHKPSQEVEALRAKADIL